MITTEWGELMTEILNQQGKEHQYDTDKCYFPCGIHIAKRAAAKNKHVSIHSLAILIVITYVILPSRAYRFTHTDLHGNLIKNVMHAETPLQVNK